MYSRIGSGAIVPEASTRSSLHYWALPLRVVVEVPLVAGAAGDGTPNFALPDKPDSGTR